MGGGQSATEKRGKVRKEGTHGERYERDDEQRKKVCVSSPHCVTHIVVWWAP